jgi:hypothetical protein
VRHGQGNPRTKKRDGRGDRSRCCGKKNLIEQAYTLAEPKGLPVWTESMKRAPIRPSLILVSIGNPRENLPNSPTNMPRTGRPNCSPCAHPATGKVHVKGVTTCPNSVLHSWLQQELTQLLALLPDPASTEPKGESRSLAQLSGGLTTHTEYR